MTRPSRRAVLRGAVRGAAAAVAASAALGAVGSTAACGRDRDEPDPLEASHAAARADARLAGAGAAALPGLAARLTPVADARGAHADALAVEIRRARPDRGDAVAAVDAPGPAAPLPSGADATLRAVRDALGTARDAGVGLALGGTRYRCGLLGSIAASCAGLQETLA